MVRKPPPDLPPLAAFTPRDVAIAGYELDVFCPACRVLRPQNLAPLLAVRPDRRLATMRFRCGKCGALGSPFLAWRDHENTPRSFDFAKLPPG
jgi:hypothetical protein